MPTTDPVECHVCGKATVPTAGGKYRQHTLPPPDVGVGCDASGTFIPGLLPPPPPPPVIPGVEEYATALDAAVDTPAFRKPQGRRRSEEPEVPMTDLGREICARMKELFYAYDNRRAEDNRSAQTTLGPSEIGTPCDRRLAMSLMRCVPVNPGGDGWAAFVGTCVHAGLAEMFLWADAGTGRFAVETPLTFPNAHVPKGTGDLLDRTMCLFVDHKNMGRWSRNKLKSKGPSPTYRIQVHTYAYGARLRGERVEHVAIIGWPRDEATLDDLYVWTEPYDPQIARDALDRVDVFAEKVDDLRRIGMTDSQIARRFNIEDDCRFCPFHMPNAQETLRNEGCNGRA